MFLYLMGALLVGVAIGTITGLLPGIHPNTVFAFLLVSVSLLPFQAEVMLVFIVAVAVSNTFTDFLPSLMFGVPDAETALSVLPGHQMVLEGRAYEAVFLTVVGGLGSIVLVIATLPLVFLALPVAYQLLNPYIHILLIGMLAWMVWGEKKRLVAAGVILMAGLLGVISLGLSSDAILFPAFTGLFGISTLIVSINQKSRIPKQRRPREVSGPFRRGVLTGWTAGWVSGILPGIGTAQAGVVAAQTLKAKTRDFLTALGGIDAANITFSIIMLYLVGKTRSGAAQAVSEVLGTVTLQHIVLIMIVIGITGCLSAVLTVWLGKRFISSMERIDYGKMSRLIIAGLVVMVAVLSGPVGLLVMFTGLCIGLVALNQGVRMSHLMAFLMVPTIIYFSGAGPFIGLALGV